MRNFLRNLFGGRKAAPENPETKPRPDIDLTPRLTALKELYADAVVNARRDSASYTAIIVAILMSEGELEIDPEIMQMAYGQNFILTTDKEDGVIRITLNNGASP